MILIGIVLVGLLLIALIGAQNVVKLFIGAGAIVAGIGVLLFCISLDNQATITARQQAAAAAPPVAIASKPPVEDPIVCGLSSYEQTLLGSHCPNQAANAQADAQAKLFQRPVATDEAPGFSCIGLQPGPQSQLGCDWMHSEQRQAIVEHLSR